MMSLIVPLPFGVEHLERRSCDASGAMPAFSPFES